MKILLLISILVSVNLYSQNKPEITIFQSNLLELAEALEKRDYQMINKMLHHKQVSEEMMKKEVEFSINDSLLPLNAIKLMDKTGQFDSLTSVVKDEMAYNRYLSKIGVDPKNCFAYFCEKEGVDVFVFAEWNGAYFRFVKIKNLKGLLD
ncbi:MAG: hypothetical protein ACKO7D_04405 [Bacteroidota bacterium]